MALINKNPKEDFGTFMLLSLTSLIHPENGFTTNAPPEKIVWKMELNIFSFELSLFDNIATFVNFHENIIM